MNSSSDSGARTGCGVAPVLGLLLILALVPGLV